MAVPTWDKYLIPSLQVLSDGQVHRRRDVAIGAADLMGISEVDRQELVQSGEPRFLNRAHWAITHLSKAAAVSSPARGQWQITDEGRRLLAQYPLGLSEKNLRRESGDEYAHFIQTDTSLVQMQPVVPTEESAALTPLEQVEAGQQRNEELVAEDLLQRLLEREPAFFEQAVLDLLMAMGYGGSFGSATRTQLSRDGGIDGVIDQDALGLSRVYVQAKRYAPENKISRPDVQGFVGALHGAQASQGVFLTTSSFSSDAIGYAENVPTRVVLIDGALLTQLMIRYGVGVQVKRNVQIVEIDEDYFE
ncbi:restriction endonuclease [Corynebacterium sp. UBA2622]|uniref:restriction endonuclease n=1 Tax=Corynebacterium sp. UBA2622 TaxID=1946393 RepID=UPI0025BD48DA|nr:restriction endonuclease [Corynebacterium sp. UBA2622]